MKNITFPIITSILVVFCSWTAFSQAPSVQLIAKKKSGLFGMGAPKMMEVSLSNQKKATPLSSDNVNDGKYYYFECKAIGDWTFDADFVKDDLPKLSITQGTQKLAVVWKEDPSKDGSKTLAVGFAKSLQLNQPFSVKVDVGDEPNTQDFHVAEEYWPGYSLLTSSLARADSLGRAHQYKDAVQVYQKTMANGDLKIFPAYGTIAKLRVRQFGNYFDETLQSFTEAVAQPAVQMKEKMAKVEGYIPQFRYVVDSLPIPAWQPSASDTSVNSLISLASDAIFRTKSYRDSLQSAYNSQNTQWVIEGNLIGEYAYKYQHMIPVLAYAFSSLDFSDTATALRFTLTDEVQASVTRYELGESYESFTGVCKDRYLRKQALFPGNFLQNLRKDSTAFSLPYYAMLRAVEDFYKRDFNDAKSQLRDVFRSCDDEELLGRFHELRILVDIKLAPVPPVVLSQLQEAKQAEARNDDNGTLDHYKQAMSIAPTFAYPAYALAEYYLKTGFPIRATPFFERAYQIDKTFLPAYREEYRFYLKSSSFKPMIQVLTTALQNGNDCWEINYNLGVAYMGDSDPTKAVQYFEHALSLNTKSYGTTVQLGIAHQTTKNYVKAREYFNKAIEIDPERPEAVDYLKNLEDQQKSEH